MFSTKMMGDGIVIVPEEGKVCAPADGEVIVIPPTKHAMGFRTAAGVEILVHVGLDSEKIENEFKVKVKEGDRVQRGDVVMTFNLKRLQEKGVRLETPVIVTNSAGASELVKTQQRHVNTGDNLIAII